MGAVKSEQLFYYCQGKQLSNSFSTMGDIFDRFKSK